jgi:hypothetical protein
LSSDE